MQIGPGSRIVAEADRALKVSKCFRRPTRRSELRSIERARGSLSEPTPSLRSQNLGAEPGVPRSPGLRNRNGTGARSLAARYEANSTPPNAVRFEASQLRVG